MTELVFVSAADDAALVREIDRIVAYTDRIPGAALADIAYTCSKATGGSTLAIIAETVADLRARLLSARARILQPTTRRIRDKSGTYWSREHLLGDGKGRLAFVFPGVPSFYPDMMRDLTLTFADCRAAFGELEEAMSGDVEFTPSSFIFPPAPHYRKDADVFASGAYAQALVSTYAGCAAFTRLMRKFGLAPEGVVGFAGGDLAAMVCAGDLPARTERVRLMRDIYAIVRKAVNNGGLEKVAVVTLLLRHADEADAVVAAFPPEKVRLVVDFSSRQKTYAIAADYAATALAAFAAAGLRAIRLPFDRPFNTPACRSLVPAVRRFATDWMKKGPVREIYSCATAARVATGLKAARDDLADRWARPVLFADTIRRMYAEGYRVFLEAGPRGLLSTAVADTLRDADHAAVALDSIHRRGLLQLQHALAQVASLGQTVDFSPAYQSRGVRWLNFDSLLPLEMRRDAERVLSRAFPRLTLLLTDAELNEGRAIFGEPRGPGAKAQARQAVLAQKNRRQRQFDYGAINPLISDADDLGSSPNMSLEIAKTFRIADLPFIGDFALGTSQLSYSDPNLKGLIPLPLPVAAEIMAEAAQRIFPGRAVVSVEGLHCRRTVPFVNGALTLFVKANLVASGDPACKAIKVLIRDDSPNAAYTWPIVEATVLLTNGEMPPSKPISVEPLEKPRNVHWSGRDVYPARLCWGRRLRGIQFVEAWSETGLDYEIVVPPLASTVAFTRFPAWVVNPLLLGIVASGFELWRSHERFAGAFSFPFRMRRLRFCGKMPGEGTRLKCYLRLTAVTPLSHICDITVTDGNGQEIMLIEGWEELSERVPVSYRDLILQPALTFQTEPLPPELLATPPCDVASAFVTDIPYPLFEKSEELWLKTLSHVILAAPERKAFAELTGTVRRRVEWLFGRVAAKEAVRRFLTNYYQARWSDADVHIWPDSRGKPHALGAWSDYLTAKIDIAIAHTAQFAVAIAAANARVGVDVEKTDRDLSEEFTQGVFTPEELELAASASNASLAIIRFWCAKEAVSKALGTGIRYSPKEMVVVNYRSETGQVAIRLEGGWLEAFKNFRGRDIAVTVRAWRDHALAFCFIPVAFFAESLIENSEPTVAKTQAVPEPSEKEDE